jgi:ABC-type antimicrobial peptide transport system permease subunit
MLHNYWKTAIRTLWKYKSYTVINVLGLSLGITCCLLLFLIIRYLISFDTFHANRDNIYRIVRETVRQGNTDHTPGVPVPLPDAFRTDFPEVEKVVFISYFRQGLVTVDREGKNQNFTEDEGLAYVEPTFFEVFDRSVIAGNPLTILDQPNEAVISRSLAQKYFGTNSQPEEVLGKALKLNKETELVITGVMEDHPKNTDFPFKLMISFATVKDEMLKQGGWNSISSDDQCYLLLAEAQSPASIESQLPEFLEKYQESDDSEQVTLSLQSLRDLHHDTRFSAYSFQTIPRDVILGLGFIALFLIVIACINFINLTTAASVKRSKEVGIRKTLGSTRYQLIGQFLGETTIITVFSTLLALGLAELLLLEINPVLELELNINLFSDVILDIALVLTVIGVSLLSGLYPALVLSRFIPTQALKNKLTRQATRGVTLRKGLVVFQFVVAQAFIVGTLVMVSQMQYISQVDLGFNKDAILTVELPENDKEAKKTLRNELLSISGVEKVSLSFSSPTSGSVSVTSFTIEEDPNTYHTQVKNVDRNYIDVYGLTLLAGTGLSDVDTVSRLVVNEAFLRSTGIASPEEAVGKQVEIWGKEIPIVGVMKDFHTVSLRHAIEPTVLLDGSSYRQADIMVNMVSLAQTLPEIEERWSAFYPEYTFDYQFVDEAIANSYRSVQALSVILSIASTIVIFIGCLGLYGLITFMAEQKTKEVGVRKVLGASVASIIGLFSAEFIRLIIIAFLIAAPIAYITMNGWLQNFEYKIDLGIGLFLAGVGATLTIALVTVSYRSIKAALANPVDSLRNE